MILQALVDQLKPRFQHEKRAQVCLWFDEKKEFLRLLPLFRIHLESMKSPSFRVLEYDASQHRGQIWIKYQVYRALDALAGGEAPAPTLSDLSTPVRGSPRARRSQW